MSDDRGDLRRLVIMAATGELTAAEVAEVEQLIADEPDLQALYRDRRRAPTSPTASPTVVPLAGPPPAAPKTGGLIGKSGGCLVGVIGFVVALVSIIVVTIVVRGGGTDVSRPTDDPVAAVIEDQQQQQLTLEGPEELTAFGRLALIYSPNENRAVLLGEDIEVAGLLVAIDGDTETVLAEFDAGNVEIVIEDIDPDDRFEARIDN